MLVVVGVSSLNKEDEDDAEIDEAVEDDVDCECGGDECIIG